MLFDSEFQAYLYKFIPAATIPLVKMSEQFQTTEAEIADFRDSLGTFVGVSAQFVEDLVNIVTQYQTDRDVLKFIVIFVSSLCLILFSEL